MNLQHLLALLIFLFSFTSASQAETNCGLGDIDVWTTASFASKGNSLVVQGKPLRLIALNAPNREKKQKFFQKGEPLSKESQAFLNKIIANNKMEIGIEYDNDKVDFLGRKQAHVFLRDGTSIQQRMLEAGLALHAPIVNNGKYDDCYAAAEKRARSKDIALWGIAKKMPQFHYPLAESSKLTTSDIGFKIIRGKVLHVSQSSNNYIINMDTTGIRVKKENWRNFSYRKLKALKGKVIEARGYAIQFKRAMYVTISSPYAIDLLIPTKDK